MLHRGTSEIFSEFFVHIPLQEWGFKLKKRDSEMSHLYETRLKKSSSTEFNENWLDSWEYLEKRLEFVLEFSVYTPLQQWALQCKKRDSNSQKCHKIRDLKTCTRQNSTKSNSMVRRYSTNSVQLRKPLLYGPLQTVHLAMKKQLYLDWESATSGSLTPLSYPHSTLHPHFGTAMQTK